MKSCRSALRLLPLVLFAPVALLADEPALRVLPQQRIVLKGDSIVRGFATGNYTDATPLRTIDGIANLLLADNLPDNAPMGKVAGIWKGLNADGSPKTVDTLAAELDLHVRHGDIRAGDWLVYEDAGPLDRFVHPAPWPDTKNIYPRYRAALRAMVEEADKSVGRDHVMFMTMFDYNPTKPDCEWDKPLDDGVHTGNDAVRDEGAALGVPVIDMNRIMDQANAYVVQRGWGRLVGLDGIHPNVMGNYVMALAIAGSLGADIGAWKLDRVEQAFRHPAAGGELETIWGFSKDPTDAERKVILAELQRIVAAEVKAGAPALAAAWAKPQPELASTSAHTFTRLRRHGRLLAQTATQPAGTTRAVSYEVGTFLQLDREHSLLVASLREEGGHDFAVGNDAFVFKHLADIRAERAIPINRLVVDRPLKSGKGKLVLGKFPAIGAFVPLGALLPDGTPHPAAGTGFVVSGTLPFLPDRSQGHPDSGPEDRPFDLVQLKWDGRELKVSPAQELTSLCGYPVGRMPMSNFCAMDRGFICPFGPIEGTFVVVVRFDWDGKAWGPTKAGAPFITAKADAWKPSVGASSFREITPERLGTTASADGKLASHAQPLPRNVYRYLETESTIRHVGDHYLIHTRGIDQTGRFYTSTDGLNYTFQYDHKNINTPQVLNQGLDGSLYLATNASKGKLRNPLFAYAVTGTEVKDPAMVHDERFIHTPEESENPFVDHARGTNIFLEGRWRHFLLFRVCDIAETNGQGLPPRPQTGLYLAEFEYPKVTEVPERW